MATLQRQQQGSFLRSVLLIGLICLYVVVAGANRAYAGELLQGSASIILGEPVVGTIDNVAFRETYEFSVPAGTVVDIRMERVEGDLDPYLLLLDGSGRILSYSDDDGEGQNAAIVLKTLTAGGSYFVVATRFGQEHGSTSGDYVLQVDRVGTQLAEVDERSTLVYGDSVIGRVSADSPLLFYFFRGFRGDVLDIIMQRTSGDLDPHLDLVTVDGVVLQTNDDDPKAEGTLDAGIRQYTIQSDGIYLIVATRFGREAGDTEGSFVLSLDRVPVDELGRSAADARFMVYGDQLSGRLDATTRTRYFRFQARRGDVITAIVLRETGNIDPLVRLETVDQIVLAQDDDGGDGRNARMAAITIPAGGEYFLVVTHADDETDDVEGEFTIQLTGRTGIVGGRALEMVYGTTVSGTIDTQNDTEDYVFFGAEGDVINIRMEQASGDLDPLVTLYDSDGKQIAFDDDSGDDQDAIIRSFELPRDDMYFIAASRFQREQGTTVGAYILTLELAHSGD